MQKKPTRIVSQDGEKSRTLKHSGKLYTDKHPKHKRPAKPVRPGTAASMVVGRAKAAPKVASRAEAAMDEAKWMEKNERRLALIDKELAQGLNAAEKRELEKLEAETDEYMDAVAPMPFDKLKELEEYVRRTKRSPG